MAKYYYAEILSIPLAIGIIHATRAVALVIGPIVLRKWINSKRLLYVFIFQGISIIIWATLIENFYLSLVGSFLVGFSTTTLWSFTYTLLQKHTNKRYYGRVVAYNDMIFLLTAATSSLIVGILIELGLNISIVLAFLGSFFIIAAFYYKWIREVYDV
jgi:MFS family permease